MTRELAGDERGRGLAPIELVTVLVGVDRLAVRHVETDNPNVTDRRCNHALLRVVTIGQREDDVLDGAEAFAYEESDAVIRALSCVVREVARRGEVKMGKLRVLDLCFLEANDVRPHVAEPIQQARQADVERVDVPGRELQGTLRRFRATERARSAIGGRDRKPCPFDAVRCARVRAGAARYCFG